MYVYVHVRIYIYTYMYAYVHAHVCICMSLLALNRSHIIPNNFWLLANYNKTGKPVYEDLETSNKINGITNMIGYQ